MAELCARYGISRKTGYKWLARFEESGRLGQIDDGIWSIHFCHVLLGRVDERDYVIRA